MLCDFPAELIGLLSSNTAQMVCDESRAGFDVRGNRIASFDQYPSRDVVEKQQREAWANALQQEQRR